ncbi:nuclear transport factor 2 family protein [Dyella sp. BiH032]|uniref:nuclear transport factor 2 family protein n=1 Tax=Dyella sp. BiH032 TaxID=3075430 RepID=UPI002892BCA4|nr:nuclear transport factor 2 family protein [Dyella sp. BiH032]WNL46463.1 nuclear transport factor 2 family protein [Dyella sp. BiH032]
MNPQRFRTRLAGILIILATGVQAFPADIPRPSPATQQDPAAQEGMKQAIQHYFRGQATGDASHMRQAFLPSAHIESVRDGKFTSLSLDEFCALFKGKVAADEASRVRSIDFVDASGNAGTARVTLNYGALVITDYFLLLKVGDEWRIANKISYFDRKVVERAG